MDDISVTPASRRSLSAKEPSLCVVLMKEKTRKSLGFTVSEDTVKNSATPVTSTDNGKPAVISAHSVPLSNGLTAERHEESSARSSNSIPHSVHCVISPVKFYPETNNDDDKAKKSSISESLVDAESLVDCGNANSAGRAMRSRRRATVAFDVIAGSQQDSNGEHSVLSGMRSSTTRQSTAGYISVIFYIVLFNLSNILIYNNYNYWNL